MHAQETHDGGEPRQLPLLPTGYSCHGSKPLTNLCGHAESLCAQKLPPGKGEVFSQKFSKQIWWPWAINYSEWRARPDPAAWEGKMGSSWLCYLISAGLEGVTSITMFQLHLQCSTTEIRSAVPAPSKPSCGTGKWSSQALLLEFLLKSSALDIIRSLLIATWHSCVFWAFFT